MLGCAGASSTHVADECDLCASEHRAVAELGTHDPMMVVSSKLSTELSPM